jgi:hypothetical protein
LAKYRSNYLARARITELIEDTGVELPERQVIDRWGEWYEQFLWASLSSHNAWLKTLSLGLQSGQSVRIVNPAKMIEWLVEHGSTEELPVEAISRFTETLRKVDPSWRTRSVHKSVSLEFEQRRLEHVTDARED